MTGELEQIVEAIVFAAPEGVSTREIVRCVNAAAETARAAVERGETRDDAERVTAFAGVDEARVREAIERLNLAYEQSGRAFCLKERPAGWRIVTRAEYAVWARELFPEKKPARLTPGALETLAIIAYRQPVTRASIEAVRGVSVDGPLQTLLDRNVVRIAGRADLPGRPLLYETTDRFLEHFGIGSVDELPNAAELRAAPLPEPAPEPENAEPAPEKPKKRGGKRKPAAPESAEPATAAAETPAISEAPAPGGEESA